MLEFTGCTVLTCARKMSGPKRKMNYVIMEECHYSQKGLCPYLRKEREVTHAENR